MKTYGALNLTESSPPQSFTEPIALDMAKEFLRVTTTDQDRTISELITAARVQAEKLQNQDVILKQWDLNLDLFLDFKVAASMNANLNAYSSVFNFGVGDEITLRRPLRSVDLIQYRDSVGATHTLVAGTDYTVDTARGFVLPTFGNTWPFFESDVSSSVLIRFTSGYPPAHPFWSDAGISLIIGMKMLITGWYEDRIPYMDAQSLQEVPFGITTLLSSGAKQRVF